MGSAVTCPGCKQRINISPEMLGQNVSCPMCKSPLAFGEPTDDFASPQPTQPAVEPPDYQRPAPTAPPSEFPASSQPVNRQSAYSPDQPDSGSNMFFVLGLLGCGGLVVLVVGLVAALVLGWIPGR